MNIYSIITSAVGETQKYKTRATEIWGKTLRERERVVCTRVEKQSYEKRGGGGWRERDIYIYIYISYCGVELV